VGADGETHCLAQQQQRQHLAQQQQLAPCGPYLGQGQGGSLKLAQQLLQAHLSLLLLLLLLLLK
jgi:hypothetical protein